ncbi:cupin domain-containing protein [Asticcacaulis sp.]|uniref:cupin domain-containing protein n=1 Tax=Asticcacaulis sp. TaxID=1872648 RepID=UPI00261C6C55|nr:cupin domain-containing protein [Asticcacaulis sp.]
MSDSKPARTTPVIAAEVPARATVSSYPEPFAARMAGREKRQLGDAFGLTVFGVNLTRLAPNSESALLHRHSRQQEFVYVLAGTPTLITDQGEFLMTPGMCVGFPANGLAHHIVNHSDEQVELLEIGDRNSDDTGHYPNDDLVAIRVMPDGWAFTHKDGSPYPSHKA